MLLFFFTVFMLMPLIIFFLAKYLAKYGGFKALVKISIFNSFITLLMSLHAFHRIGLEKQYFYLKYGGNLNPNEVTLYWGAMFDHLALSMSVLITFISFCAHLYLAKDLFKDPNSSRFIAYLSLSVFFMLFFVTAYNHVQLFVGWMSVGLSTHLLFNEQSIRFQSNKANIKDLIVNFIGDFSLLIAVFFIFMYYKAIDYQFFNLIDVKSHTIIYLNLGMSLSAHVGIFLFLGVVCKLAQIKSHIRLFGVMASYTSEAFLMHLAIIVTAGFFFFVRISYIWDIIFIQGENNLNLFIIVF